LIFEEEEKAAEETTVAEKEDKKEIEAGKVKEAKGKTAKNKIQACLKRNLTIR